MNDAIKLTTYDIEVGTLPRYVLVSEAGAWLEARGITGDEPGETTVAELFAIVEGRRQSSSKVPVGFSR